MGRPMTAAFELTPNCNLNCQMCYIHRPECGAVQKTQLKPVSFWRSVAEQARDMGVMTLVITGGETFLYPQAEELLESLMGMGFLISLNTNGTLLDERRIAWLKEHRPTKINISLYGGTDGAYERLCGCPDGFTRVSRTIDRLMSDGQNVYLNSVLVPENVADIPRMVEFAKPRGLIVHGATYIFPAGRYGIHTAPTRLTPEEAAQAELLLERLQFGERPQLEKCLRRFKLMSMAQQGVISPAGGFHDGEGCSRSNCTGGRSSFAVSWDGRMMPCVLNAGVSVSLEDRTLAYAWEELKQQVEKLPLPTDCVTCPYQVVCNACPATVFNETGRFDTLTPYTCEFVRAQFHAQVQLLVEKGILKKQQ